MTEESICLRCRAACDDGEFLCPGCSVSEPERQLRLEREIRERKYARPASMPSVADSLPDVAPPPVRRGTCKGCGGETDLLSTGCEACIAKRRLQLERRHVLSRVPFAWTDDAATFRQSVSDPRLRKLADDYELADGGVVVCGPTGWGKTAAVARAVRRLVGAALSDSALLSDKSGVVWLDAYDVALARRKHKLGEGDPAMLRLATDAHVLVVDEVGFEPPETALFEVVNRRYLLRRATLLTSGSEPRQLGEKYGANFVRRIIEPAGVLLTGWS